MSASRRSLRRGSSGPERPSRNRVEVVEYRRDMNRTNSASTYVAGNTAHGILGPHPLAGVFSLCFTHRDGHTAGTTPRRNIAETSGQRPAAVEALRDVLTTHHASPATLARLAAAREAFIRQGLPVPSTLSAFPRSSSTRKGNIAEIVLGEYVVPATTATLPVYRLRHNPNVDQSMKGDDVLAFDLGADPPRIIVGEAKFRGTSTTVAVSEFVDSLKKSHANDLPASLPLVAEHFQDSALADRIFDGASRSVQPNRCRSTASRTTRATSSSATRGLGAVRFEIRDSWTMRGRWTSTSCRRAKVRLPKAVQRGIESQWPAPSSQPSIRRSPPRCEQSEGLGRRMPPGSCHFFDGFNRSTSPAYCPNTLSRASSSRGTSRFSPASSDTKRFSRMIRCPFICFLRTDLALGTTTSRSGSLDSRLTRSWHLLS